MINGVKAATLPKVVVLISGSGSNLGAILEAALPMSCELVISNEPAAGGLLIASSHGVPTAVVDHRDFEKRSDFDHKLIELIAPIEPTLIVLAGFMRRLGAEFVKQFSGKVVNIHPSLLPKYPGLNTYQRALDAGDKEVGVSIHWVTEELDAGPLLAQQAVCVSSGDQVSDLRKKVQEVEHYLYPAVIKSLLLG